MTARTFTVQPSRWRGTLQVVADDAVHALQRAAVTCPDLQAPGAVVRVTDHAGQVTTHRRARRRAAWLQAHHDAWLPHPADAPGATAPSRCPDGVHMGDTCPCDA